MENKEKLKKQRLESGSCSGAFPCPVCRPLSSIPTYHRHYSTKTLYNNMLSRQEETVDCMVCKTNHPIKSKEERLIIFFSTSTVHNVVLEEEVKSPHHFNIETICGGTIDLLRRNFSLLYYEEKTPMDIILSAGLNDLKDEEDVIMHNLFLFKRDVLGQNKDNTFYAIKLLRPPMYCWFPKNGTMPEMRGSQPYENMLEKVNRLNDIITKLNKPLGYNSQTSFEFLGLRGHKKTRDGQRVVVHEHMLDRWREYDRGPASCLHLDDKLRVVAFKKIISHIVYNLKGEDATRPECDENK